MNFEVRYSVESDGEYLQKWFEEPGILIGFPLVPEEVPGAIRIWLSYIRVNSAYTVLVDGQVAGMGVLYLQPYEKCFHQCLFAILVGEKYRNLGVGKFFLKKMIEEARTNHRIEILHLEVYRGNPALRLYERLGFCQYGVHCRFIKIDGKYFDKILMQKTL
jgi:GNAT superfamily N-acetyltransferase